MRHIHLLTSLLLLFMLAAPVAAVDEMELDWSPDLAGYPDAAANWPLCGDTTNPSSSWTEGDPCTSTLPDRIVSSYGPRNSNYDFHRGIDLRTEEMEDDDNASCGLSCIPNTRPVFAVADGEIDEVEYKCDDGELDGFRIQIEHGNSSGEWYTRYVHMSSLEPLSDEPAPACTPGEDGEWEYEELQGIEVEAGEHIGYTGKSTSNNHHLHFEVRKDDDWARDAVHPMRRLPAVASPGSLEVDVVDLELDLPAIEVTGTRLDTVRVELQVAGCDVVGAGLPLDCDPFATLPYPALEDGYYVSPTFYDYERMNYQYSHRGGSVWDNTGGFPDCPFSAEHGSKYKSDLHVTEEDFNDITVGRTGGVTPYWRSFRFDDADVPFYSGFDYTCVRAVAFSAGGSVLESDDMACRATEGGTVFYLQ